MAQRLGDLFPPELKAMMEERQAGNKIKRKLADEQYDHCIYCAKTVPYAEQTVEHLIPVSAGGPDALWNLAMACFPCNQNRGNDYDAKAISILESRGIDYKSEMAKCIKRAEARRDKQERKELNKILKQAEVSAEAHDMIVDSVERMSRVGVSNYRISVGTDGEIQFDYGG